MGDGLKPALLLLLVLSAFALPRSEVDAAQAGYAQHASISDCFTSEKPLRFWESRQYVEQNPFIRTVSIGIRFRSLDTYSSQFDSVAGADSWELGFADGSDFLSFFPSSERSEFSGTASELDAISASRNSSADKAAKAHDFVANGWLAYYLNAVWFAVNHINANTFTYAKAMSDATNIITEYFDYYPDNFWGALSGSAQMFEDANTAGRLAASKVDEKLSQLSLAGAGSASYSGVARNAYLQAEGMLANAGVCGNQARGASQVLAYFNSSPNLPHTMPPELAAYLRSTVGAQNGSAIMLLASTYRSLGQALSAMDAEYEVSKNRAQRSVNSAQAQLAYAKAQRLDLIINPQSQELSGAVSTGTSSTGFSAQLAQEGARLEAAKERLASAGALRSSRAQDYLAGAIEGANSVSMSSASISYSLTLILFNANASERLEMQAAQSKINVVSAMLSQQSSQQDALSREKAEAALAGAESIFNAASAKETVGERYGEYHSALLAAQDAQAIWERRAMLPSADAARAALDSLDSFLDRAKDDGIDVSYEQWKASEYRRMLSSVNSSEACLEIIDLTQALRTSVEQKLQAKYSEIDSKYATLYSQVRSIRLADSNYLPEFNELQGSFINGKLDVRTAIGRLRQIEAELDRLILQVRSDVPSELSKIISSNARELPINGQYEIGRQSDYRITILAANPSSLEYSGAIQFNVTTTLPLFTSDAHSDDRITDAYPEGGKSLISIPSVSPYQEFSFVFEKQGLPAHFTTISRSCQEATSEFASANADAEFFAAHNISSLRAPLQVPQGAIRAGISYGGMNYPAQLAYEGDALVAGGTIKNVPAGKNRLSFDYAVARPFSIAASNRSIQRAGNGGLLVSYVITASSQSLECDSALVRLSEPYPGLEEFEVIPLGSETVSDEKAIRAGAGGGSIIGFSYKPLRTGIPQEFAVSFALSNSTQAFADALQNAETVASIFNRTQDLQSIADAKALASLNRTDEALLLLTNLQESQKEIFSPDYDRFISENSSAAGLLSSALAYQSSLAIQNLTSASAQLAALTSAFQSEMEKALSYADAGKYAQAANAAATASSNFRSSLSSLAWKSSSQAMDGYAKARKVAHGARSGELAEIEGQIALSQQQFSSGNQLESFGASSRALRGIAALQTLFELDKSDAKISVQKTAAEFSTLQKQVEASISAYSQQYSALSAQSKKSMPITPTDAQKAMQDAVRGMDKASSAAEPTQQTLALANESYSSLESLAIKIESVLAGLEKLADSSLNLAKIALSEARQKAAPEDAGEVASMQNELDKAGSMFLNSLYADSLASSDRVLSAATLFIQSKSGAQSISPQQIALGVVSVLFVAGAAYYFWSSARGGGKPKGKVEIPRAEPTLPDS